MQWKVLSRRCVYTSEWVEVWVDDIDTGDGQTLEHHVLRMPKRTVSALVVDEDRVLLLWRHRFITDTWGWEIPAGWVEPGESLVEAARREVEEETGHRAATLEPLITYNTLSGLSSLQMNTFVAADVTETGPIRDQIESTRVEWIALDCLPELASKGEIADGPSLTGLMYYLGTSRR